LILSNRQYRNDTIWEPETEVGVEDQEQRERVGKASGLSGSGSDVDDFLPLHPFELRILLVLAERPAHGYPIIKAIEDKDGTWKRVLPANLYRRLRDMLARGLVREVEGVADGPEDERQRRVFALTELGRRVALAETRRLEALVADAKAALRET
jgi:DNA-binding PadR family transcriptional regulator